MHSIARRNRHAALQAGAPHGSTVSRGPKNPAKDHAGRAVLDTIGREHLMSVLSGIVPEGEFHSPAGRLLAYLQDHTFDTYSLTRLGRDAGLTVLEIVELVRNHDIAMGVLRAARHVPDVLEDIAEDARSQVVDCPSCRANGWEAPEGFDTSDEQLMEMVNTDLFPRCSTCLGVGYLRRIGDSDARKILFEALGILKRGGAAVQIQKNTQINNFGGGSAPEDVSTRIQKIFDVTPSQ